MERPLLRALARRARRATGVAGSPCCGPRSAWRHVRRCLARFGAAPRGPHGPRWPRLAQDLLREAAVFVPAVEGIPRVELEARAAGVAVASPPGRTGQAPSSPQRKAARLMEDSSFRERRADEGLAACAPAPELLVPHGQCDGGVHSHHSPSAPGGAAARATRDARLESSSTSTCTRTWSHDCSIDVDELIDHAEEEGLGAIAVTDHNVFGGALEAVERGPRPQADRHPRRRGENGRAGAR